MSITVVIPCYKKSQYLQTVFESIKSQTAFNQIDEIIVSENSEDFNTKIVCDSYPELNIRYYQQSPSLPQVEHLNWILQQPTSEYTAMLHDDDWWYPTHLQTALETLHINKDCSCYFSNFIFAQNETLKNASFHFTNVLDFFIDLKSSLEPFTFDFQKIAAICYLYTPFHMSGMVGRTTALKEASRLSLSNAKSFYVDRIYYPYIALWGKIAYSFQILCAIRIHTTSVTSHISNEQRIECHREGSEKINQLAIQKNVDIKTDWREIKSKIPSDEWKNIIDIHNIYFGIETDIESLFYMQTGANMRKKIIKNLLPAGITTLIQHLRK